MIYEYPRAEVVDVYDGDTVTVDIDLGFGVWARGQKMRLYGIDTPEMRGDDRDRAIAARDFVFAKTTHKHVTVRTRRDKKGKYGRWLVEIILPGGQSLNDLIVNCGLGVRREY